MFLTSVFWQVSAALLFAPLCSVSVLPPTSQELFSREEEEESAVAEEDMLEAAGEAARSLSILVGVEGPQSPIFGVGASTAPPRPGARDRARGPKLLSLPRPLGCWQFEMGNKSLECPSRLSCCGRPRHGCRIRLRALRVSGFNPSSPRRRP